MRQAMAMQYDYHHDLVVESSVSPTSSYVLWTPPEYDSDVEIHPVLRTYSEPDVSETDSDSSSVVSSDHSLPVASVQPEPNTGTGAKRRKLTRMNSQEAVNSYVRDCDSSSDIDNLPEHTFSAVPSNVDTQAASSICPDVPLMSSQEAVDRFVNESTGQSGVGSDHTSDSD